MSVSTLYDYAAELLAADVAALATTTAGAPDRAFVSPSLPSLDCCPQLTVHVQAVGWENTQPLTPFPAVAHRTQIAGVPMVTLVSTIVRCQPAMDAVTSTFPSASEIDAAAQVAAQDLWAIWNHTAELIRNGEIFGGRCPGVYLDQAIPIVISGGCAGWSIPVRAYVGGYEVIPS